MDKLSPDKEKLFKEMFHDYHSESYYKYFDTYLDKDHDGFGYGSLYQRFHDGYIDNLIECFSFLLSGCTFENYGLFTRDGDPVDENTDRFSVFHALVDKYYDEKEDLNIKFFEYMYKRENEKSNIKDIPENDIHKQIIKSLIDDYGMIHSEILPNNKYKMKKNVTTGRTKLRQIIRIIILRLWIYDKKIHKEDKWKITKTKVYDFLTKYIDLDYEDEKIKANIERYIHDVYCDTDKEKNEIG